MKSETFGKDKDRCRKDRQRKEKVKVTGHLGRLIVGMEARSLKA